MDPRIAHSLATVAKRFSSRRFAWSLALLWILLAVGFRMSSKMSDLSKLFPLSRPVFLGILLLLIALAYVVSRRAFKDIRWIAAQIESRYPSLKERLLTAIGIDRTEAQGYLRHSLLEETFQHSRDNDWKQTVPTTSLAGAWFAQCITLGLCIITGLGFLQSSKTPSKTEAETLLPGIPSSVQVDPGNTELERGTNLVITARFSPRVPAEVWLESRADTGKIARQEMRRNLKDPVFGGYLLEVNENSEYLVDYLDGQSQRYQIKVFDYPSLVRSDATIHSPAYSKISDRTIADTRRVTVVEGATLTWECHVNKPLISVELIDEDGTATPMEASESDPLLYTSTFTLTESRKWKLQLKDDAGRSSKIDETLSAKVLPNLPSETKLASATDQSVSPLEEIQLKATANDDFAITKIGISYSLSEQEPREIVLVEGDAIGKKKEVEHLIELERLHAQPDQMLSYYFWVEDIDTEGNPRRTDGDMFFADVRPFEEIFRQGQSMSQEQMQQQQQNGQQSQAGQKAEELAELQKKIITSTWNVLRRERPNKLTPNFSTDVDVIADSQGEASEKASALEEEIQDPQSLKYLDQTLESMKKGSELLRQSAIDTSPMLLRDALAQERSAYEGLLKLRAREHQIVQSQQRQQQQQSGSAGQQNRQQQIEQLKLNEDQDQFETERQAQSPEEESQRETRQVMNRLDELARRQKDINQQLKDLETAIQEAKTDEAKKELEEELKRLRENQEELLRDSDELLEKMNEAKNQESLEKAKQEMEQARNDLQKSAEALAQNQTAPALSSGTRAQRQMDETREELRKESSNQFEQAMKDLVQEARDLEKKQNELTQKTIQGPDAKRDPSTNRDPSTAREKVNNNDDQRSGLRPEGETKEEPSLKQEWKEQKENLEKLLTEMRDTVSEAESSEPLLAEELYDSFRETKQSGIEPKLDQIPQMVERRMDAPARKAAEEVSQGVQKLRERIEKASERVLGSDEESLRRALSELERAKSQLNNEISNRTGEPTEQRQQGERQQGERQQGERQQGERQQGERQQGERQPGGEQPGGENQGDQQADNQGDNPQGQPAQNSQQQNQPNSNPPGRNQTGRNQTGRNQTGRNQTGRNQAPRNDVSGRGGSLEQIANENRSGAPLTGNDFAEWSDRLRDVEEMIRDPELRGEAARIRETARDMRKDFLRHSKEPQWDLVKKLVAQPLEQLRKNVEQQLLRESAEKNAVVPIDRDPVPSQYERRLQKYYENLGIGTDTKK